MTLTFAGVERAVDEIATDWRAERKERQGRRHLERGDFDRLREAGVLSLPVPADAGGLWNGMGESTRGVCSIYRTLAAADPSVALVSVMHPSVIAFWLASPDPAQPDWEAQRAAVFASALAGEQWGTITSEPGSGGDISRTRSVAAPVDGSGCLPGALYSVTGDKHFGSGSGITDRMMTTAVPADGDGPMVFVLDVQGRPWDGSAGMQLIAEWDGMGMAATQSHAMRLDGVPAVRMAWGRELDAVTRAAGPLFASLFTAVVLGVVDEAVAVARNQLRSKAEEMRPYERVEWVRAERDHWLAVQAFEGGLRAIESGDLQVAVHATQRAKESVAELAETTLLRLTRVLGGGTFSQRSPFSHWFEDVRALGFLRPPWGLAFDGLFATSFD